MGALYVGVICDILLDSNEMDVNSHITQTVYYCERNANKESDRETSYEESAVKLLFETTWSIESLLIVSIGIEKHSDISCSVKPL